MPINQERLRDRRARLEAELKALRAKEAAEEERRCLIVGRAVLDHAAGDDAFRTTLMTILDRQLSRKRERQLFGLALRDSGDGAGEKAPDESAAGPP